jgi:hypothetical protein
MMIRISLLAGSRLRVVTLTVDTIDTVDTIAIMGTTAAIE